MSMSRKSYLKEKCTQFKILSLKDFLSNSWKFVLKIIFAEQSYEVEISHENLHVSQKMPYFARKIQKSRLIWIRK